jgi:hypothetical protein
VVLKESVDREIGRSDHRRRTSPISRFPDDPLIR